MERKAQEPPRLTWQHAAVPGQITSEETQAGSAAMLGVHLSSVDAHTQTSQSVSSHQQRSSHRIDSDSISRQKDGWGHDELFDGVLEPLLSNLSSMLLPEFDKIKNVYSHIEFLRDELSSMCTTLQTMSKSEEQSPQTQIWMNQLRELCYDIEDRIEENFMLLSQDSTSDGFIKKFINIGDQLKELKERALEVSERQKWYKMDTSASSAKSVVIDPRLPGLFEEAEKLVGINI
ncbi:hypothetical protein C2845_PM13G12190 [Panicum miliaceum]|uniref:Disease resistance N-terminal domain-containing protein n=1 Tax=Panicum miliaceum TaxID=4540 RepID=A0A3L6RFB2_PANMI|nr:hypothetical protein C2845_PM13G12190 [Panicum miliaceum]